MGAIEAGMLASVSEDCPQDAGPRGSRVTAQGTGPAAEVPEMAAGGRPSETARKPLVLASPPLLITIRLQPPLKPQRLPPGTGSPLATAPTFLHSTHLKPTLPSGIMDKHLLCAHRGKTCSPSSRKLISKEKQPVIAGDAQVLG